MAETELLTVVLSWNRPHLVQKTIESYFSTVSVPHRLIVVDNGSNLETVNCLRPLSETYGFEVIFFEENRGGTAYNTVLDRESDYRFVHFSENDIQYLLGWDLNILNKFRHFPDVAQISPFSPFPQVESGEVWEVHPSTLVTNGDYSLYLADTNVGGTSIVRKQIIDAGVRWSNFVYNNGMKFPFDGQFSQQIKSLGWNVAWNDTYVGINWGHNILEFQRDADYYVKNSRSKPWLGFDGFKQRLKSVGSDLVQRDERYRIFDDKTDRS